MLELFGPTRNDIQQLIDESHSNAVGLLMVLLDKDILTMEEFLACKSKAQSEIDQLRARQREERISEFKEQYPSLGGAFFPHSDEHK